MPEELQIALWVVALLPLAVVLSVLAIAVPWSIAMIGGGLLHGAMLVARRLRG